MLRNCAFFLVFLLSVVTLGSCWTYVHEPESPKDFVGKYEEIKNVVLYPIDGTTTKTNVLCKGIHLEFDSMGKHFSYDLQIYDIYSENAVVTITNNGKTHESKPIINTFEHAGEIRIVVFDLEKKYISGYFVSDSQLYFIEETDNYGLIAVAAHNYKNIGPLFPTSNETISIRPRLDEDGLKEANELNEPPIQPPWAVGGCPQTRQVMDIGFAADVGFFNSFSGTGRTASDEITRIATKMIGVYEYTLNIRLRVSAVEIQQTPGGPSWNVQRSTGCPSINDLLNAFTSWVRSTKSSSDSGSWQLMTDCYPPPGTVGIAWVGALCGSSRTGVNSLSRDFRGRVGTTTWTTVAHELGHNYNAPHTWGNGAVNSPIPSNEGLMSYRGDAAAFTRESQRIMCEYVGRVRTSSRTRNCFQDDAPSGCECTPGFCGTCGATNCGPCPSGTFCDTDNFCKRQCTTTCRSDVAKPCGVDGCGGTCGSCSANEICQNGGCVVVPSQRDAYLAVHNAERTKVGVSAISWSDSLATLAQNAGCGLSSNPSIQSQGLGENVIGIRGTIPDPRRIIENFWVDQDGASWTCESNVLNRYTQMIWSTSTQVGCAVVSGCNYQGIAYEALRCVYQPGGNIPGRKPVPSCTPTCTPTQTCGTRTCGQVDNGCGQRINCGTCGSTESCVNGRCQCNRRTQCFLSECGEVSDGCGGILQCTACPTPPPCVPNAINIVCQGRECGEATDNCGNLVFCGACSGNQSCEASVCTGCIRCAPEASCIESTCVCRPGYTGDGTRCVPNPDIGDPDDPISNQPPPVNWNPVFDSPQGSWQILANSIIHTQRSDSTGRDMVKWDDTLTFSFNTRVTFAVQAWKERNEDFAGLLLRYKDDGNMLYMIWERSQVRFRWLFKEARFRTEDRYVINQSINLAWNGGEWYELKAEIEGDTYSFNTDSFRTLRYRLALPRQLPTGPFGLIANGNVKFENVTIFTSSRVQLQLFGCLSEDEFKARVAQVLRIQSSRIVNFDNNGCATTQKKQQGGAVTYSFDLLGAPGAANSEATSSLLNGYVAQNNVALDSASMQSASGSEVVQRPPPSDAQTVTLTVSTVSSAALGAGAIAGIVIASIVVGTVAAGGAAYGVKKFRDSRVKEEPNPIYTHNQTEMPEQQSSPQGSSIKGIDVYNFNSDTVTSITARAPPRKVE